jgi:hypothetical protein
VTDTHAIEFDFGNNWAEAIGQSAYYSFQTKKKKESRIFLTIALQNAQGLYHGQGIKLSG